MNSILSLPIQPAVEPSKEQVRVGHFRYMFGNYEWKPAAIEAGGLFYSSFFGGAPRSERWLVHDDNDFCAAEFPSKDEAIAACERWSKADAHLLTVSWDAPPEDADDSNRGVYRVHLAGCRGQKTFCSGWHSMEAQIRFTHKFRDLIAAHGIEVARTMWDALV